MEIGRSSSVYSAYASVRAMPRTSPSALTISVTTRPQPPWRFTRRRNAVSVIPAIGAMAKGDCRFTEPIFMNCSVRFHVRRVDFDADRLADQVHREHEPRLQRVLAHQPSDDAAQRAVRHLDHHPLVNHGARVVLQLAADEHPDAVELAFGNRRRLSVERHDVHDADTFQHGQRVGQIEVRETVAREQRPVDLLLAILPAAPAGHGRQERVDVLPLELIADHLLVARPGPDREPLGAGRFHYSAGAAFVPTSYAFFTSSFFHSMIACVRSFARYFWNSALRLSLKTCSLICSCACSIVCVWVGVIDSSLRIW